MYMCWRFRVFYNNDNNNVLLSSKRVYAKIVHCLNCIAALDTPVQRV